MAEIADPHDPRPLVVVTGASQGIGLELARCFAKARRDVMVIARDADAIRRTADAIAAEFSVRAMPLALDITAADALARLDAALAADNSYCDVLVNCAGSGLSGEFTSHGSAKIQQLIDLNISALTAWSRHLLPGMRARGRGGILNVASLGGLAPGPYQAAYYASKAYVISLSEALAAEVSKDGVRISVLAPGPCRSDFHQKMGSENDLYFRLLPVLTAARAARSGYKGFVWGRRVIIPGIFNNILALALRILPHAISTPIISFLLKPRQPRTRHA